MLLSKGCEYGLRAMIHLASLNAGDAYLSIRRISEEVDVPYSFLAKVFQQLARANVLKSLRGPQGGVALARRADAIFLKDIVTAVDGSALFTECVLGLPGCGNRKPCPLHNRWAVERERLETLFESMTLSELAERTQASNLRLTVQ